MALRKGLTKSRKFTAADTGFPGRPKKGRSKRAPKARGLPGWMATFQNEARPVHGAAV